MPATQTQHEAALAFLYRRIDYERAAAVTYSARRFKLGRMRELLARLSHPERDLPIVHVAGTKGKGSTSAMIAASLTAAGYRTGLFTSPHLERAEERLAIDGAPCDPDEFVRLVETVRGPVEAIDALADRSGRPDRPTYFEVLTAMALVHFAGQKVDAAVLEVGMGGRLDSTNVCHPAVCVITSISFDHTRQLGNTLAAIAREKAGIVKPGVPVVSGVIDEEPRRVIEAVCRSRRSPLFQLGREFRFSYRPPRELDRSAGSGEIDFASSADGRQQQIASLSLGLLGRHQGANAAVALAALAELRHQGWRLPDEALRRGLADVRWPARVELVQRRPAIVIDAAHNVASVAALVETLEESFSPRRRLLVFGTTREKDARGMLQLLLPRFDEVLFTRYLNNPRAVPPEELRDLAAQLASDVSVFPDPASAWREVSSRLSPDDLLCVTGSFFLASEMRAEMEQSGIRPALA